MYVLVAWQWLAGHLPYTTVFDHKPVGIYAIFAAALGLLTESIVSIRVITTVTVFATSLVISRLAYRLSGSSVAGLFAAVIYPAVTLGLQGLSSNTELFFIFFNICGLLFLLDSFSKEGRAQRVCAFAAGLAFGFAIQIKYVVIVEITFFVAYLAWVNRTKIPAAPGLLAFLFLGGLLPTALIYGYFFAHDMSEEFLYANFEANRRFVDIVRSEDVWRGLRHSTQDWIKWNWVTLATIGIASNLSKSKGEGTTPYRFLLLWLLVAFAESCSTLKFFKHYFLVTLPPICLLTAIVFGRLYQTDGKRRLATVALVLVVAFQIVRTVQTNYGPWLTRYFERGDRTANVANRVRQLISAGDYIYVVNDQPIIYFLANSRLPTKYLLPANIISEASSHMARVDYRSELDTIFSKAPRVVVLREEDSTNRRVEEIRERLRKDYVVETKIEDATLYLRRVPSGG